VPCAGKAGVVKGTSKGLGREILATHLTGAFLGCKHASAAMRDRGGGSVVNIGSILSFTGDGYLAAYTAMKGVCSA
jgi:NAD(P)-dependent dehydrogenase (short-subunit alcohol dehydrogenase family)